MMKSSIRDLIAEGAKALQEAHVPEPRREAGLLLMHALQCDRAFLIAHGESEVAAPVREAIRAMWQRRAAGEPAQYITGHQEFFKLDFEVTPDVLIPRPETELVVEGALQILGDQKALFADIGTGSGCIAVSILHELPAVRAIGVDVSSKALQVALRNAEKHGVSKRLSLRESDLFSSIHIEEPLDLIVSNPPYVSDADMETLGREVRHEPEAALAGGPDGLKVIARLMQAAPRFLRRGGHLIFEIGFEQIVRVEESADSDIWSLVSIRKDLQGIPRVVILRRK